MWLPCQIHVLQCAQKSHQPLQIDIQYTRAISIWLDFVSYIELHTLIMLYKYIIQWHTHTHTCPRQPIFLWKMTVSGKLCCVALPFCCVVVVALPFFQHLLDWLFMHTHTHTMHHSCRWRHIWSRLNSSLLHSSWTAWCHETTGRYRPHSRPQLWID